MDALLTPVSQTYRKSSQPDDLFKPSKHAEDAPVVRPEFRGSSSEEALETLRSQPSYDTLLSALKYLQQGLQGKHVFDIRKPSPQSAQIVHVLVTEIVPNYWTLLRDSSTSRSKKDAGVLIACLQSLTGINAVLAYLRALLKEAKSDPKNLKNSHAAFNLCFALELLSRLIHGDDDVQNIWNSIHSLDNPAQVRPMRQELITLFASGKIVSLSAEAEDICRQADQLKDGIWMSNSKSYIDWLARNLVRCVRSQADEDTLKLCADISTRAMRLGNSGKSY